MSRRKRQRGGGPGNARAGLPSRPVTGDAAPPRKAQQPEPPAVEPAAAAHHRPPGADRPHTPAAAPQAREHVVPRVHHPVAASPAPPEPVRNRPPAAPRTPEEAFDRLYLRCAGALVRQAELLIGDAEFARQAVARAFDLAWQRWPEVAQDSDPVGWVRAAAYEYALAPWQEHLPGWVPQRLVRRVRPRTPDDPVAAALLDLPPVRRRAVLLYDGVGLDLPEAAAEIEATTVSAAGRITLAREELAEAVPDAADDVPQRLSALLDGKTEPPEPPAQVRGGSERTTHRRTVAAYALTGAIALAALVAAVAGPGTGARPHHDATTPTRRPQGTPHDAPHELGPAGPVRQDARRGPVRPDLGRPGPVPPATMPGPVPPAVPARPWVRPHGAPHEAPDAGALAGWVVRPPLSPAYVPEAGYTDGAGPHPGRVRRRAVEP